MKGTWRLAAVGIAALLLFLKGMSVAPVPTIAAALILLLLVLVFCLMRIC